MSERMRDQKFSPFKARVIKNNTGQDRLGKVHISAPRSKSFYGWPSTLCGYPVVPERWEQVDDGEAVTCLRCFDKEPRYFPPF